MDNNQQTQVTDDQELANVLAGMNQQVAQAPPVSDDTDEQPAEETAPLETPELQFEETPLEGTEPSLDTLPPVEAPSPDAPVEEVAPEPAATQLDTPALSPLGSTSLSPQITPSASPELDSIKKDALDALRPLVDKLDLPADEKFDTLLLIIRSTDDKSLVNATFDAAKAITDETKRAQALLDVIKEIDYFSAQK